MIEFHAWEARVWPIRMALKLALVLLPIALLIASIPLLFVHHVTPPQPQAHQYSQTMEKSR
jgi:hypothetical protein